MTERYCPITGEPLPLTDPGRVVSQAACNQLRVAASNLADIMHTLDQMLQPGATPTSGGGGHTTPASRPPLNLGLLATIDDDRDTIDIWANNLAQHVIPGFRYRPGDWHTIQAILTQYADKCGHWQYQGTLPGVHCIQRVTAAIRRLEAITSPPEHPPLTRIEQDAARERIAHARLTIGPATQTVQLITGRALPRHTVYSWERRGKISGTGQPKRYLVQELLDLQHAAEKQTAHTPCDMIAIGDQRKNPPPIQTPNGGN